MMRKMVLVILIICASKVILAQSETYTIKKANFSSDKYDEFSPVYYNKGIVFCSNRNSNLLNRSTSENKGLIKIYYIDTTQITDWKSATLFSKELTTIVNDGPVTFNKSRDTIYYSRNLEVNKKLGDVSSPRNKLGIFFAEMVSGEWTKIREFRLNNEWYNLTTPCLSPDGRRLYFASDKLEGFGGSDLYYCQWNGDRWDNPVNMGPIINTSGNESYPFVNQEGGVFFSSDGHPGLGGKDIFYTKPSGTSWLPPVALDAPINSEFDDFAFIADSVMSEGYFSSKRGSTCDIYHFKTKFHQIFYCENQRVDQVCFKFGDESKIMINEEYLKYVWNFGDGSQVTGLNVEHCFPGPGKYAVRLDVVDKKSGRIFFSKVSYDLELKEVEQPIIKSSRSALVGETVSFDGLTSHFSGSQVLKYTWYFGDGDRTTGDVVSHLFKDKGDYEIKLGLILKQEKTGIIFEACTSKIIKVFSDEKEKSAFDSQKIKPEPVVNISNYDHAYLRNMFSVEKGFNQDVVFIVEILSSKTRLSLDNEIFRKVPQKYSIKEIKLPSDNLFHYIIAEEMNLISTYSAFNEIMEDGYTETRIRTFSLEDPAAKELNNLKKVFGVSSDVFFKLNDYSLSSEGTQMLDQILGFLTKYPKIRLEIAVHTDNIGSPNTNLSLSQKRADSMVNYLVLNGVSGLRLVPMGFGGSKPLVPNFYEADRKLNRRVEFTIINK
jgi:outer membrane protein OmpA-like peptidoglycan-associated protein